MVLYIARGSSVQSILLVTSTLQVQPHQQHSVIYSLHVIGLTSSKGVGLALQTIQLFHFDPWTLFLPSYQLST